MGWSFRQNTPEFYGDHRKSHEEEEEAEAEEVDIRIRTDIYLHCDRLANSVFDTDPDSFPIYNTSSK